jgi:hypothetical protein
LQWIIGKITVTNQKGGRDMNEQIKAHGEDLKRVFDISLVDPDTLARKLHRIELEAQRLALDYCNGANNVTTENWEELTEKILAKVDNVTGFKRKGVPVFVNGDARGYALKINNAWVKGYQNKGGRIYTDWGGYGILAPEFDGN